MKRVLLALMVAFSTTSFAQTSVYLAIDHNLGSQPFVLQASATNNLGNDFNVTRLEYYVSSIELIHDGGTITPVTDKYMLVNASDSTYESLGSFNITNLEAIRFAIGVDAAKNHSDPASYPSNHPLAPKSPSMHWGWAAGYRFIAMEGKAGAALAFTYELHALDDANYFAQTIMTAGNTNGSDLVINLSADYARILENINVSSGVVVHGSTGAAKTSLENFSWYVFTSSEGNAAMTVDELSNVKDIVLAPNPARKSDLVYVDNISQTAQLTITDITGKQFPVTIFNNAFRVDHLPGGLYIVRIADGAAVTIKKLIVQ